MSKQYGVRSKGHNNSNCGGGHDFDGGGGSQFSSRKHFQTTDRERKKERGTKLRVSYKPKGQFRLPKLTTNLFGWYQVTVRFGHFYSKDEVMCALLSAITPEFFVPHYWRTEKTGIVFFIDDFKIAERLQRVDRSIQMDNGYRLFVNVCSGTPLERIDETFKEKVKLTIAKRYNEQARALDLSRFHADPEFKNMFVALFKTPVMVSVLDIIEENIPDLEELNLNGNGLKSIEALKNGEQRLPNLKILYLNENQIPSLARIWFLRNFPISELMLENNPLRKRFKDSLLYISEVRRKFPKLIKLDGAYLAPPILFDVGETCSLPTAKASFLVDPAGADLVRQFLQQYFLILDSDNRQPLLSAYHEQAMMSISIPTASKMGRLDNFRRCNRNFRGIMDSNANRIRQLKVGSLAIVSTLNEWPKTQHDLNSFTVDLTLFTPQLIFLNVTGLFKEYDASYCSERGNIRSFSRQLVIVPAGGGFCLRNEMILITNATRAEAATFMKFGSSTSPATSVDASGMQPPLQNDPNQPSTSTALEIASPAEVAKEPDDATKIQMVQDMSTQSNMNVEWSRICLEDLNWDYNHAKYIFDKLNKENKLPPEAFTK